MSRFKFITFDVDGTILDSQNMIVKCLQMAASDMGIECPQSRTTLLSGVGLPLAVAVTKAVPHIKTEQIEPFVQYFRANYEVLKEDVALQPLYDGALDMLETLKSRGYILGIFTSKIKAGLDTMLDKHNIRRLFDNIKTPDLGPGKPDPFLLNMALRELQIAPEQTIFVGDSTYDILAGRAANVQTLGVAWGYHTVDELNGAGAHKIANRMDEIVSIVENWQ